MLLSWPASEPSVVLLVGVEKVKEPVFPRANSLLVKLRGLPLIRGGDRVERAEKGEKLRRWNISLMSSRDLRGVRASGTCRKEKTEHGISFYQQVIAFNWNIVLVLSDFQ